MDLNKLAQEAYNIAMSKGWHDKAYSDEVYLMLVMTELAASVEADRKHNRADLHGYKKSVKYISEMELPDSTFWKDKRQLWYNDAFVREIKNTVEDRLADAVIRLLDLAGLRGIEIDDWTEETYKNQINSFKGDKYESFAEKVFAITRKVSDGHMRLYEAISEGILYIRCLAKSMDIDLEWHIQQKMRYNKTRCRMHGKKY